MCGNALTILVHFERERREGVEKSVGSWELINLRFVSGDKGTGLHEVGSLSCAAHVAGHASNSNASAVDINPSSSFSSPP